ncbi:MAG: hypothetical protein [Caudoviricetes sp.]|nr:MAG: hypothetical protein [Caudoviricetes sp.]
MSTVVLSSTTSFLVDGNCLISSCLVDPLHTSDIISFVKGIYSFGLSLTSLVRRKFSSLKLLFNVTCCRSLSRVCCNSSRSSFPEM